MLVVYCTPTSEQIGWIGVVLRDRVNCVLLLQRHEIPVSSFWANGSGVKMSSKDSDLGGEWIKSASQSLLAYIVRDLCFSLIFENLIILSKKMNV